MISGLLWFDDDPRKPVDRKIGEAAQRYLQRFGVQPTLCLVHQPAPLATAQADGQAPGSLISAPGMPHPVAVVADRRLRPHHYWLGLDEPPSAAPAAGPPAGSAASTAR